MSQALEFTLGIETSEFLEKLRISGGEVLSLASTVELARMGVEHLSDAINQGAALKAMSNATGESVAQLYELRHGLEAIGAQGDVAMLMMRMQNALSGMSEEGQRTDVIFARLGLDINKLRGQDAVTSLREIATAMGGLNSSQMAGVGEQLFGRFGAQAIEQMARDMKGFNEGFSSGSGTGALLDKFATVFQAVKADWGDIEGDVQGIWVAIAGNIAPALEGLFEKLHSELKDIGPAIAGALQSGQLETLLVDALNAAFEQAGNYGSRIFSAMAVGFGDELAVAVQVAIADMGAHVISKLKSEFIESNLDAKMKGLLTQQSFAQNDYLALSKNGAPAEDVAAALAKVRGINAQIADLTNQIAALDAANDADFRAKIGDAFFNLRDSIPALLADVSAEYQAGAANAPHVWLDKFDTLVSKLAVAATSSPGTTNGMPGAGGLTIPGLENHYKPDFTALEKMGFVMSGHAVNNPNELREIDLLSRIANAVEKQISPGLAHAVNVETTLALSPFHNSL